MSLRIGPGPILDRNGDPIGSTGDSSSVRLLVESTQAAGAVADVNITGPVTAFGELRTAEPTPLVQIDAVNGAIASQIDTRVLLNGIADDDDEGQFRVQSGTTNGGFAFLSSRKKARYRAGQGLRAMFTAMFTAPSADSSQTAGLFNPVTGLQFGHNGNLGFGLVHRTAGEVENRLLTFTTGAGGGETATVTVNSVAYSVPLTAGTVQHNALEIETWFRANQSVWHCSATDDLVCFLGYAAGPAAGTYTLSSATAAAGFTQGKAGQAVVDDWYYADADAGQPWNMDTMDGTGPSGMTIDPTKLNVYQIDMQYLGAGGILFSVEDPNTGRLVPVHLFPFGNSRTSPTLRNPSFSVGWCAASLGSTTNLTVKGASASAFLDGKVNALRNPAGSDNQRTGVGSTLTSIIAIRVRHAFNFRWLLNQVLPVFASASVAGTKAAHLHLLLNPTFDPAVNNPVWQFHDSAESYVEIDTTGTTFSDEGEFITSRIIGGGGSAPLDLTSLDMVLQVDDILCIAAVIVGGGGTDVDASITWRDD